MITPLRLRRLAVRSFRNVAHAEIEPAARLNVLAGDNGQGKTSVLEAIYFVATSRSFRTHRSAELVRHGDAVASVSAHLLEEPDDLAPLSRAQAAAIQRGAVEVRLDGNKPPSLAHYATRSPVVVFHPDELALSTGAAAHRRTLLDRVALFVDPAAVHHRSCYLRALRARTELLRARRRAPHADGDLDAFEELCARHGAALTRCRRAAALALAPEILGAFRRIAAPELTLDVRYEPGGCDDEATARQELARMRERDAGRPTSAFGPHRDDLALVLDGHAARLVASQGQHRALALAMKLAELAAVAAARGLRPILLLDDVSSELDAHRTAALFELLAEASGQIFLTTTRPDLVASPALAGPDRQDYRLEAGRVVAVPR